MSSLSSTSLTLQPEFHLSNECMGPLYLSSIAGPMAVHYGTTLALPWNDNIQLKNDGHSTIMAVYGSKSAVLIPGEQMQVEKLEIKLFCPESASIAVIGQEVPADLPGLSADASEEEKDPNSCSDGDSSGDFDSYTGFLDCESSDFGEIYDTNEPVKPAVPAVPKNVEADASPTIAGLAADQLPFSQIGSDGNHESLVKFPEFSAKEGNPTTPANSLAPQQPNQFPLVRASPSLKQTNLPYSQARVDVYAFEDVVIKTKDGYAQLHMKRAPRTTVKVNPNTSREFYRNFKPSDIPPKATFTVVSFNNPPKSQSFTVATTNSKHWKQMLSARDPHRDLVVYLNNNEVIKCSANCDFMGVMRRAKQSASPLKKCFTYVSSKFVQDNFSFVGTKPDLYDYLG